MYDVNIVIQFAEWILFLFKKLCYPVGGGVLAHTILGVDFNEQTGDIR